MTNSDSGTKLNPGDRVRPSFAGDIQIAAVALETRWLAAEQAAEEAERQAKVARGEAEEARQEAKDARDELGAIRAERDALRAACQDAAGTLSLSTVDLAAKVRGMGSEEEALRGKLGAAEGDSATLHAALVAERKESAAWRSGALAAEGKLSRETEEVARLEAALRTRDVQLDESRRQRKAAESALAAERSIHETAAIGADKLARQIDAVQAAWGKMRAFLLALPRPLVGAAGIEGVDMVDKALGGVAVGLTLEQRVAEIEARLGRLESGEALAKMLEAAATLKACGAIGPNGRRCVRGAGHGEPELHGDLFVSWGRRP
jgi:hypothetical protein